LWKTKRDAIKMEEKADVAITVINNLKSKDSSVRRRAICDLANAFPHAPVRSLQQNNCWY